MLQAEFHAHLEHFLLQIWNQAFLRESWFFFTVEWCQHQHVGTGHVHWHGMSLFVGPLSWQSRKIYMWIYMCMLTHIRTQVSIFRYTYLCSAKNELTWYLSISRSIITRIVLVSTPCFSVHFTLHSEKSGSHPPLCIYLIIYIQCIVFIWICVYTFHTYIHLHIYIYRHTCVLHFQIFWSALM